ncbi:DUF3375 domain-containing protein [Bifidobacterium sp. SO1]|uniref:DUF3375 domain-containing protein n=1 Tax=Bifidobacterium sp. SO1 TaxID=2809029 RepID=UPI001BDCE971|nr:DUF3375 domain-containing protein [Bifidobacterium sp. SO1]MBT1161629.1 DUF3375 domain-containing protein [Bifidobacterium sp. SO1]
MGDVRREMERLRPVYETGVLRLLLRKNSMMYVALLRAAFNPLTGELPREILEERFAQSLSHLIDAGEYALEENQDLIGAAHQILVDLTREGDGDYAWLANSLDMASHRFLYRLTARAHRAIEALGRLQDTTSSLSGAQANSIIMEIEHARMQLTADPNERIRLLKQEITAREREIEQIQQGRQRDRLSDEQVEDIIAVIHKTLRDVPIDLRELVLAERDNGDALRRRMQAGDMDVNDNLTSYHDAFRRSFDESDSGRRFNDAFQVIITDEGRQQIDDAVAAIAKTPYLAGESSVLLDQITAELERIYDGIEAVRQQIRVSDEAISRLVRQQTDTRYRTMLVTLNRLYTTINAAAKAHPNDDRRPYRTDEGDAAFAGLPTRPARSMSRATVPSLDEHATTTNIPEPDIRSMIVGGGPRIRHMIRLIMRDPVTMTGTNGDERVDIAASFNRLPADERRESEIVGFLSELATIDGERTVWHCTSLDGTPRDWTTKRITAGMDELNETIKEG